MSPAFVVFILYIPVSYYSFPLKKVSLGNSSDTILSIFGMNCSLTVPIGVETGVSSENKLQNFYLVTLSRLFSFYSLGVFFASLLPSCSSYCFCTRVRALCTTGTLMADCFRLSYGDKCNKRPYFGPTFAGVSNSLFKKEGLMLSD